MLNKLKLAFLGTGLIVMSLSTANGISAKPIFTNNQLNQSHYLAQNLPTARDGGRLLRQLNLSTEQERQMGQIKAKYESQMRSIKNDLRSERQKLKEMMVTNQSANEIRNQHRRVANLSQRFHDLRFENMLEIREVLTLEQRQEFAKIMEEKRGDRRARRNK